MSLEIAPVTKRVFIGFSVDFESNLRFLEVLKRLKIDGQKHKMEFQWMPLSNFHVTLKFLGAVTEESLPKIRGHLETVGAEHSAFSVECSGLGSFPDPKHCRVLWAGVQNKRSLQELQSDLEVALASEGFEPEERDYRPHLTLARLRKSRNVTDLVSPFVRKTFGKINVNELVLYESLVHGQQVVYKALQRVSLERNAEER